MWLYPTRVQVQQRPGQKMLTICLRLFLFVLAVESCNLWTFIDLVNGAQARSRLGRWSQFSRSSAAGSFDKYQCPAFLTEEGEALRDQAGQLVVPISRVRQDFTLKNQTCSREQFTLVVSNAITVHKSQGVPPDKAVYAISDVKFASGLHWVAVSRVSKP
jgi:ATP-dependent DNA helicase PIF1